MLLFIDPPKCNASSICLKRTKLINYYNELVIQLRIAERLINTSSITREIREDNRTDVEKRERTIIELLRGNILPLLHFSVSIVIYLYAVMPHNSYYVLACINCNHYDY